MEENTPVEERKFERPEVKITAREYWDDLKARWGIHRYEWQEASKELKEMAMARIETLSATWTVDYAR